MSTRANKGSPLLEVRNFSFWIGKKAILRNVSFRVDEGEYVSIVGPNGAGKSTLLKCLDRIHTGGTGQIALAGRPLAGYSQKEVARLLGYVPQADGRLFPFTVEQFILMARYPYLSPFSAISKEDHRVVGEVMRMTETTRFAPRRIDTLSGGERQEVFIAAALAQGPKLLLLDEPTTFLDYGHQDKVQALLRRIREESGTTILAVTHDVNRAALQSDRLVALVEGTVALEGTPEAIMRPDVLAEIYASEFLLVDHPRAGLPVIVPDVLREGDA